MKITKSILAQIIKEEMEELQHEGVLDKLKGGKSALQKAYRAATGSQRAQDAGNLAAAEVDVAQALEDILKLLQEPGNQTVGTVRPLVSKLLDQVRRQVKDSPPTDPAATPPPAGVKV